MLENKVSILKSLVKLEHMAIDRIQHSNIYIIVMSHLTDKLMQTVFQQDLVQVNINWGLPWILKMARIMVHYRHHLNIPLRQSIFFFSDDFILCIGIDSKD